MEVFIFGIILLFFLIGIGIYWGVKEKMQVAKRNHYISLFKPGYSIKAINIEGHVRPIEHVYFEYEIIDSKDNYAIMKIKYSKEPESEHCISSLIMFYDLIDVYDNSGKLIERIRKENFQ